MTCNFLGSAYVYLKPKERWTSKYDGDRSG